MMRSMFSGVTGLRAHQSRMDVIAHNIANVNTTGFKSSRMTFADAFSQTISGASAPNPETGRGGTNPMQVGLGVNVSSIQRMMTPGAAQRTDDPLHLMIQDDGFFVVGDEVSGLFFTRAGDFQRDEQWNIHMPNGMMLQGWQAPWGTQGPMRDTATGEVMPISREPVRGIQITEAMRSVPPRATGNVAATGNLRPTDASGPGSAPIASTISFQDSLGTGYSMNIRYVLDTATGHWTVQIQNFMTRTEDNHRENVAFTGLTENPAGSGWFNLSTFNFNQNGYPITVDGGTAPNVPPGALVPGSTDGGFVQFLQFNAASLPPGVYFGQAHTGFTGTNGTPPNTTHAIRLDFSGLTQFDSPTNTTTRNVDGLSAGTLMGLSVGGDGIITGTYSNGQTFDLWQIALARFDNPAGLAAMGGNLFAQTSNSGQFDGIGLSVSAAGTSLLGGTLEMSNVDLAAEFTEMITTQRGFQANSRIISTSDEMLQELVNLRR